MMKQILYLLLLLCFATLKGQSTQIDLSKDGVLDTNIWRNDTEDFRIERGWLSLASSSRKAGHKLVSLTTTLGVENYWRGAVRLSHLPSIRNYAYILLGCYSQNKEIGEYNYLALSIGGGRRKSLSLAEVTLQTNTSIPWSIKSEFSIIETYQLPDALGTNGVSFEVYHNASTQTVSLKFVNYEQPDIKLFEGRARWSREFIPSNSFGVLCVYTSSRHSKGFYFGNLSIDTQESSNEKTSEDQAPEGKSPNIQSPLLSEVMANPLPGCPEYIELYNPNEEICDLDGYSLLFIGSSNQEKRLQLDGLSIAAKDYLVLTSAPDNLIATYPETPQQKLKRYRLPQLPNSGFRLRLLLREEEVDAVLYERELFPQGIKSKKGVSIERPILETNSSWKPALLIDNYATPGRGRSQLEVETKNFEKDVIWDELKDILNRAASDPNLNLTFLITSFSGDTLVRYDGQRALKEGQTLIDDSGRFLLPSKTSYKSGLLTLSLVERKTRRIQAKWILKFISR